MPPTATFPRQKLISQQQQRYACLGTIHRGTTTDAKSVLHHLPLSSSAAMLTFTSVNRSATVRHAPVQSHISCMMSRKRMLSYLMDDCLLLVPSRLPCSDNLQPLLCVISTLVVCNNFSTTPDNFLCPSRALGELCRRCLRGAHSGSTQTQRRTSSNGWVTH